MKQTLWLITAFSLGLYITSCENTHETVTEGTQPMKVKVGNLTMQTRTVNDATTMTAGDIIGVTLRKQADENHPRQAVAVPKRDTSETDTHVSPDLNDLSSNASRLVGLFVYNIRV